MYVLVILRNIWGGGVWLNNWGYIYFCEDFLIKCFGVDFVNLLYLYMFVFVFVIIFFFVMVLGFILRVFNLGIFDIFIIFV